MTSTSYQVVGGRTDDSDELADTQAFLKLLDGLLAPLQPGESNELQLAKQLFRSPDPVFVGRAPGRLDVMGGISDYSGALVLQMPTQEACHVALQRQQRAGAPNSPTKLRPSDIRIVSLHADGMHRSALFTTPMSELYPEGAPLSYADARQFFEEDPPSRWAAYVAGCLLVLSRERDVHPDPHERVAILVSSEVPEGKGVSSSAALEVATMSALAAAHGVVLAGRDLALLCQKVENLIVGAPCGIMDQMASALGAPRQLMALLCQPAQPQGSVALPPAATVWGVDSGVRHTIGGADYGSVRIAAFMGLRMLSQNMPNSISSPSSHKGSSGGGASAPVNPARGGYLANFGPGEFSQHLKVELPATITGKAFIERYGSHLDPVTTVDPEATYYVRVCASHPVHEHFRVRAFRQLMALAPHADAAAAAALALDGAQSDASSEDNGTELLQLMGELMYQSHASYSRCGLGSPGTDRLVALVREEAAAAIARGEAPALYGAKITGGGSGGTVAILGTSEPAGEAAVAHIVARYRHETSHLRPPVVFRGSSIGAIAFGHRELRLAATTARADSGPVQPPGGAPAHAPSL